MDKKILKTIQDIKKLKIQGATNIARSALAVLGDWTEKNQWTLEELVNYAKRLAFARPTEPLTQNCLKWFLHKAKSKEGQSLLFDVQEIIDYLEKSKEKTVRLGLSLIKNGSVILTHCHSSSVTTILIEAKKKGKRIRVFLTETRPKYQGHITARELVRENIDATLITDSQAPFVISREDKIGVDLVVLGADAIDKDGSAVNKVGSYSLSLSAFFAKIPLYVVAVLLKFSPSPILIEERSHREVWENHPRKLKIKNPAFDRIPAEFITGFITEAGIIKPADIKERVVEIYPWKLSDEKFKR